LFACIGFAGKRRNGDIDHDHHDFVVALQSGIEDGEELHRRYFCGRASDTSARVPRLAGCWKRQPTAPPWEKTVPLPHWQPSAPHRRRGPPCGGRVRLQRKQRGERNAARDDHGDDHGDLGQSLSLSLSNAHGSITEEGPKLATILAPFLELNPATRIGERK